MMAAVDNPVRELQPLPLHPLPAKPLVSVLMANYNYERFVAQSIESVLAQTYTHWELIICDDGSSDDSLTVIEGFTSKDSRIKLFRKPNGGHASALNLAFEKSRGSLLCFLDSDDLFFADKIEQVVARSEEGPEVGFFVHRVMRVGEDRQREGVWPLSDSLPEGWYGQQVVAEGGIVPYMPPTSGLALRREIAEHLFPLPMLGPLRICPDQVIMRLAPLVTTIGKVGGTLTEFRLHGSNSYGERTTSPGTLTKEIELCRELWKAQHQLLRKSNEEWAVHFKPIESSAYFLYLQYLRSKLTGHVNVKQHYSEFMLALKGKRPSAIDHFWRYSLYLPTPIFTSIIKIMLGQGALKQLLAKVRRVA